MSRILLFGGSFNPIHHGHLRLAVEALEQFNFDRVWLMPSGTPPHRQAYQVLAQQRLRMLELAAEQHPRLEVCSYELESAQTNYTVDTVAGLRSLWPEVQFSFLTGMDVVYDHVWKDFGDLLGHLELFLVASRPGYDFERLLQKLEATQHRERLRWLQVPLHEVSSSMIRQRLSQGRSIHFWVPEAVRVYAEEQGIYTQQGPVAESV